MTVIIIFFAISKQHCTQRTKLMLKILHTLKNPTVFNVISLSFIAPTRAHTVVVLWLYAFLSHFFCISFTITGKKEYTLCYSVYVNELLQNILSLTQNGRHSWEVFFVVYFWLQLRCVCSGRCWGTQFFLTWLLHFFFMPHRLKFHIWLAGISIYTFFV